MATITTRPNGHRWIQFVAHDGRRKTIRLGKMSAAQAATIKVMVEDLTNAAHGAGSLKRETALWLAETCGDMLRERLAAVGLCESRASATLGAFIDGYMADRTDIGE